MSPRRRVCASTQAFVRTSTTHLRKHTAFVPSFVRSVTRAADHPHPVSPFGRPPHARDDFTELRTNPITEDARRSLSGTASQAHDLLVSVLSHAVPQHKRSRSQLERRLFSVEHVARCEHLFSSTH